MTELDVDLSALLPPDLPDGREAVEEGKAMASGLERARSLYCEEKGGARDSLHLHEHRPRNLGRHP